jgi:hypothetical protein
MHQKHNVFYNDKNHSITTKIGIDTHRSLRTHNHIFSQLSVALKMSIGNNQATAQGTSLPKKGDTVTTLPEQVHNTALSTSTNGIMSMNLLKSSNLVVSSNLVMSSKLVTSTKQFYLHLSAIYKA